MLYFNDHSRVFKDFKYIYPVLSRRSQGVSLGINLNINNACNWRCIYCQVDGLIRNKPIPVELAIIEYELNYMLNLIYHGDFLKQYAPKGLQRLNDICISGNGESTLADEFIDVINLIGRARQSYQLKEEVKTILITNGSQLYKPSVQQGIALLAKHNGVVWFKVDALTDRDIHQINQINLTQSQIENHLRICTNLCCTYIQTCMFKLDGQDPSPEFVANYVNFVIKYKLDIAGVLLYSVARNPALAEGNRVSSVNEEFLHTVAKKIEDGGVDIKYYM